VEIVHKTGIRISGTRQQISAIVAGIHGEIHERVNDENARGVEEIVVDRDVMRTGVSRGGELRSRTVGNGSEIDSGALDEVGGDAVGHRITDEAQMLHADRGDDRSLPGVNVGKTDGEDDAGEVDAPVEDGGDARAGGAGEVDQEEIVVQKGSGDECVSSEGSGEELGDHQTDVDGRSAEVGLGRVVGALEVSVSVEEVDGSAEGEVVDVVTETCEVSLGEGVQERSGPDEVGDDETEGVGVVSSVRVPSGERDAGAVDVLAGEPVVPGGIASGYAIVKSGAVRHNESVQTARRVTSIVAHLTDDPRGRRIRVEFIGTTSRKIVRRMESGNLAVAQDEEEGIVSVTAVDVAEGNVNEEAQQASTDYPSLVTRNTDVMRRIAKSLASSSGGYDGGGNYGGRVTAGVVDSD